MPTYKNCYELVREVRLGLNEYDDALASGDDTVGAFRNDFIVTQINRAISELFALIVRRSPGEFIDEATLTAVNSVLTLPSNFGKLILLRDSNGYKVYPIAQDERRYSEDTGSERLYFRKGQTLVLDKAGLTTNYTLIYKTKPRNIHMGRSSAGSALSITLDSKFAVKIADYYNGMMLENVTQDWANTISDYSSARVATLQAGTAAAGDLYGLVPEIPEWSHVLIAPRAVILCKMNPVSKDKPSREELQFYNDQLLALFREHATPDEDTDWEGLFTSYEPKGGGVLIE